MNVFLLLCFFNFGIHASPTHDVAIAMFRILASDIGLDVDISLDMQDLAEDLDKGKEDITLADLQTYLDQHTRFEFDGIKAELRLKELKAGQDHFLVKGMFNTKLSGIKEIQIQNTCLVHIPDHSNIIQVQLNGEWRDFRMTQQRTRIQIKY